MRRPRRLTRSTRELSTMASNSRAESVGWPSVSRRAIRCFCSATRSSAKGHVDRLINLLVFILLGLLVSRSALDRYLVPLVVGVVLVRHRHLLLALWSVGGIGVGARTAAADHGTSLIQCVGRRRSRSSKVRWPQRVRARGRAGGLDRGRRFQARVGPSVWNCIWAERGGCAFVPALKSERKGSRSTIDSGRQTGTSRQR